MSTLVAQTISNGTVSTSSANVIQGSAKAWVNYNLVTTAIRSSYGVSSVTSNGPGTFTVNFTTAFANAEYAVAGFAQEDTGGGGRMLNGFGTPTTTSRTLEVRNTSNSLNNAAWASAAFFA